MMAAPLPFLHAAAIAVCYGLAAWHLFFLIREVRAQASADPASRKIYSLSWPVTRTDRYYRNQFLYGPHHRRRRTHMYFYSIIGFFLLIAYAMPRTGTDAIPT